jgi:hypothetical protein
MQAQKPKRIRKKPATLNPTYASLKTGSQQKNPIAFIAFGTNVYVLRKLFVTEQLFLPNSATVDHIEAARILARLAKTNIRSDERAHQAHLSKSEFDLWQNRHNVSPSNSMYGALNEHERDTVTLHHIFKIRPSLFLSSPVATVRVDDTTFYHRQRGHREPIHCRIHFTGTFVTPDEVTLLQPHESFSSILTKDPSSAPQIFRYPLSCYWKPLPDSSPDPTVITVQTPVFPFYYQNHLLRPVL